jgi:hypothetical protein
MTDKITPAPFHRREVGNMADEIMTVVYQYAKHITTAEAIGVLELCKHQIVSDLEGSDD